MADAQLSSSARLAYWWLRTTSRGGVSTETNAAIGRRLGICPEQVRAIARELRAAGLVTRTEPVNWHWRLVGVGDRDRDRRGDRRATAPDELTA